MRKEKNLVATLILMGASGIIAQILLLRELLIYFHGNELSIGIILANWLLLESAGAFLLGKQIDKTRQKIELFIFATLMLAVFLPVSVYLSRILKDLLAGAPGEATGLARIFYSSFLVLVPVSLIHGALFTFGCKIHSLYSRKDMDDSADSASSIGKVYIYETIGAIVGGVCLTLLLIPYFNSFHIAFSVSLLNVIACILIGASFWKGDFSGIRKFIMPACILLFVACAGIMASPVVNIIHMHSLRNRWPGQEVVYYRNSIYGNIAVAESRGQYTFFSDGTPVITVPTPDIISKEEFVHFSMLFHPRPKNILIISGGAGGVINEALKHNIERIDYVELDPLILKAVKKFPTEITEKELSHPKVNIEYIDGKVFVKTTSLRYDVIFIGLDDPSSLSVNRLFTQEFFLLLAGRLNPGGIIVLRLPGSVTYIGNEMKNLNACVLNALKNAFAYIKIIPGDGTNIYMASASSLLAETDKEMLVKRFEQRGIKTRLIGPLHIEYKLQAQWTDWFLSSLEGSTKQANQDFIPLGAFFSLSYWNAMLSPGTRGLFRAFEKLTLRFFIFILIGLFVLACCVLFIARHPVRISLPISVAATGFSGMLFDLIIIFSFQIIYGYVFHWLGLLVSVFMAGTLAGSFWVTRNLRDIKNEFGFFLKTEAAIIIFALVLPAIISIYGYGRPESWFLLDFRIAFLAISMISGLLVGIQFPLANKIHLAKNQSGLSETAGLLYGADLLGGWASGMIGGIILLPVLGVFNSCLVVVFLKLATFILFYISAIRQRLIC
jgi:spermidine synthase